MIPVIELVLDMRYELGDMQGLNITDHELITPINKAARMLYGTMSDRYVHAGVKRKPIVIDEGKSYTLPPDFVRVHQVLWERGLGLSPSIRNPPCECSYRITGDELYVDEGEYTLEYYYIPVRVSGLDDLLDVPEGMRTWLEDTAVAIYRKDMNRAMMTTEKCCEVLAGREVSHFEDTGPVQILGGRV
ncbi:MAG: hypothetical protein IJG51_11845 [Synergistaceae bacterium]|nr:hypothetical protein [Synergistaceae bacterium]MBQ6665887.1 hypothetical protein [Synergistaceae bacterium]